MIYKYSFILFSIIYSVVYSTLLYKLAVNPILFLIAVGISYGISIYFSIVCFSKSRSGEFDYEGIEIVGFTAAILLTPLFILNINISDELLSIRRYLCLGTLTFSLLLVFMLLFKVKLNTFTIAYAISLPSVIHFTLTKGNDEDWVVFLVQVVPLWFIFNGFLFQYIFRNKFKSDT